MVGEDWSQPPDGVAEIMFPAASTTSMWTVSPRTTPLLPTVGSPSAPEISSEGTKYGTAKAGNLGGCPAGAPGRSSNEARSVTSDRRLAAYCLDSNASSGTSGSSPYQASRSANASFAHSTAMWTVSAVGTPST
jgi:hypothetical protein